MAGSIRWATKIAWSSQKAKFGEQFSSRVMHFVLIQHSFSITMSPTTTLLYFNGATSRKHKEAANLVNVSKYDEKVLYETFIRKPKLDLSGNGNHLSREISFFLPSKQEAFGPTPAIAYRAWLPPQFLTHLDQLRTRFDFRYKWERFSEPVELTVRLPTRRDGHWIYPGG